MDERRGGPLARWYLIYTKPGCETVAQLNLERQGYHLYFPRLLRQPRGARGGDAVIDALFPRYLFLNLDVGREAMGPVRSTLGVASIVRFGFDYAVVPDFVVEGLKAKADPASGLHRLREMPSLRPGSGLRIVAGVFDGLEGVFLRESAEERVVVLLDLLGQRTSVEVPSRFVRPEGVRRALG